MRELSAPDSILGDPIEFSSCRYEEVGSDCYAIPGLDVDVIAPLERLRFRYQGLGFRGVDAEGFPATRRREVAD
jgi:hypothetical protein